MAPKVFKFEKDLTQQDLHKRLAEMASRIGAEASAFPDDTKGTQAARKDRASRDKVYFMQTYLPHYFESGFGQFHHDVLAMVGEFCRMYGIALPRGFGKSTLLTFADTLHDIVFGNTRFTIIISETEYQAAGFTAFIRLELEINARLAHDFGVFKPKRAGMWGDTEFRTAQGVMVKAVSSRQSLRGVKNGPHRPDTAKIDDLEDDKSVKNREGTKEKFEWIRRVVWPALDRKRRRVIWVGNVFSKKLAFKQYLEMKDSEGGALVHPLLLPAILENGESLWPEQFPLASLLEDKRVMGSANFDAEMQHNPRSGDDLFNEDTVHRVAWADIKNIPMRLVEFLDPALGKNKKSDTTAMVKIGRPLDGDLRHKVFVLNSLVRRIHVDHVPDKLFERQAELPAQTIGVEDVAFQYLFARILREEENKRGVNLPFKMIAPKGNKELRISGLAPLWERGVLVFVSGPEGGDNEKLLGQFFAFNPNVTNNEDDGPDATAQALALLEAGQGKIEYATVSPRRFGGERRHDAE